QLLLGDLDRPPTVVVGGAAQPVQILIAQRNLVRLIECVGGGLGDPAAAGAEVGLEDPLVSRRSVGDDDAGGLLDRGAALVGLVLAPAVDLAALIGVDVPMPLEPRGARFVEGIGPRDDGLRLVSFLAPASQQLARDDALDVT